MLYISIDGLSDEESSVEKEKELERTQKNPISEKKQQEKPNNTEINSNSEKKQQEKPKNTEINDLKKQLENLSREADKLGEKFDLKDIEINEQKKKHFGRKR